VLLPLLEHPARDIMMTIAAIPATTVFTCDAAIVLGLSKEILAGI